jgi:hypothetical protein
MILGLYITKLKTIRVRLYLSIVMSKIVDKAYIDGHYIEEIIFVNK